MDRSASNRVVVDCECGAQVEHLHWAVIDESCRPELVRGLSEGDLRHTRCPTCRRSLLADQPIVVHRSVVTIRFSEEADAGQDLDETVLSLPFAAATVVLGRDPVEDLQDLDSAVAVVESQRGPQVAQAYREHLVRIATADESRIITALLEVLARVDDKAGFAEAFKTHDELLMGEGTIKAIDEISRAVPELSGMLTNTRRVLIAAREDVDAAWVLYSGGDLSEHDGPVTEEEAEIEELSGEIERLMEERRFMDVIELSDTALAAAHDAGVFSFACWVHQMTGAAYTRCTLGDPADNMEQAIRHFTSAADAVPDEFDDGIASMHLGLAYGTRVLGDRRRNRELAVSHLRRALAKAENSGDRSVIALVQTNLANALQESNGGNRPENLREARKLCHKALRWRSPKRNAEDWAYTQVNLGSIVQAIAEGRRGRAGEAWRAYRRVLREQVRGIPEPLIAQARHNVAGMCVRRSERTWLPWRRRSLTREAEQHYAAAAELFGTDDPLRRGRALGELADIAITAGDPSLARAHSRAASALLTPRLSPTDAVGAAERLGMLASETEDWNEAAQAFATAIEAHDLSYFATISAQDRASSLKERPTLSRWAAFAFAKAGELENAASVLEGGRTRELRRRAHVDAESLALLATKSPGLRAEFERSIRRLQSSALADDADAAAREHQEVLARIRSLSGLGSFATSVSWQELTRAAEISRPLMYVNPTPAGTMLLSVSADLGDGATPQCTFLEVTSKEIAELLLFGRGRNFASYLFAVGASDGPVQAALDEVLPWIGERIASPLLDHLDTLGATAATLVLSGPLAGAPIHACEWSGRDGPRVLADSISVSYAPSAALHVASLDRSTGLKEIRPRLLAVADSQPGRDSLPASRAEVATIADIFGKSRSSIALGPNATSAFLVENLRGASHLHIACHARGAMFDYTDAHVVLADSDLPLGHVAGLQVANLRLAVMSACQTGMVEIGEGGEEVLSIGTALLAGGSACVIASLWPVDDYVTALMMVKLYESLLSDPLRSPREVLSETQRWLRTMSEEDHQTFVAKHHMLAGAESTRGSRAGYVTDGHGRSDSSRPFGRPVDWAPFIAVGA